MRKLYINLPGLPPNVLRPRVIPLRLREQQLNVTIMMTLMAVNDGSSSPPYIEVLFKILREITVQRRGAPGLDYQDFKSVYGNDRSRLARTVYFLCDYNSSNHSSNLTQLSSLVIQKRQKISGHLRKVSLQ
jgi:hypothetical protein